jgi:hypothetical protein
MAELLIKQGFEVIARDGKTPGCFDLARNRFREALKRLEERATGASWRWFSVPAMARQQRRATSSLLLMPG